MITIFLRFPSAEAFEALMPQVPPLDGCRVLPAGITALHVVGRIYDGGEWDAEGNTITPPVQLPGWHVNVLGDELPEEWQPYQVFPAAPVAVFGGDA